MYENIVKSLRHCAENDCSPECPRAGIGKGCISGLKREAADAIEELNRTHDESAAYQRGLDDAWEAARKIANSPGNGGFPELYSIFGSYSYSAVLNGLKAAEAIAKIRAYEASQEIHVGDEVDSCRGRWVVCKTDEVLAYGLDTEWVKHIEELSKLEKTGRNFPEVAALLDKLKGDAPDV